MASFYPKTKAEVPFLTELEFCSKVEVNSDYFTENVSKLTNTTGQTTQPKQPPSKQNTKTALQLLLQKYTTARKHISPRNFASSRSRKR